MARNKDERGGSKAGLDLLGELAGALAPGLGSAAKFVGRGVQREWARNGSVALAAAERSSGMSREDIRQAIEDDPRLVPLATRLLYAAGMNGHDATLSAMGTVFGDAVREPDGLDECEMILASLADLTDNHAAVLRLISQPEPDGNTWVMKHLYRASPLPNRVVGMCVAGLQARGLIMATSAFGGHSFYDISELGKVLLEVLEQHAGGDGG